jgi:hypothetical protein
MPACEESISPKKVVLILKVADCDFDGGAFVFIMHNQRDVENSPETCEQCDRTTAVLVEKAPKIETHLAKLFTLNIDWAKIVTKMFLFQFVSGIFFHQMSKFRPV